MTKAYSIDGLYIYMDIMDITDIIDFELSWLNTSIASFMLRDMLCITIAFTTCTHESAFSKTR